MKDPMEHLKFYTFWAVTATLCILFWFILGCLIVKSCHAADEYTTNQYVDAIYMAEGGANAQYPYGIRSISCGTRDECRKICWTTVERNKQRYEEYGFKTHSSFISFLASRYAPVGVGNDPKGLNKNWIKNVQYFLRKGETQ